MRAGALLLPLALAGCSAPGELAVHREGREVHLKWSAFGDGGYEIERRRQGADWGRLARVPAGSTTYTDATARDGVTYAYRVRAKSGEVTAMAKSGEYTEDHDHRGGGATAAASPGRPDLHSLSAAERARLVTLILEYIDDAIVERHSHFEHEGRGFLAAHRELIGGLEAHLRARGVRLPRWNPATRIPPEFNVVKGRRPALVNLNPSLGLPSSLAPASMRRYRDERALIDALVPWHNRVHMAVGGTMSRLDTAPAAPIFWCWHAFVDDVYESWLRR